jgi:hypothetical protein
MIYNGILYDGNDNLMKLCINNTFNAICYINKQRYNIRISDNCIFIGEDEFIYRVHKKETEIIVIGVEIPGFFSWLLPCLFPRKFFILTNKQQV